MEPIREKLRSESGASILLALLFFLLCAMVGASVLMAAASNAGKSRSGREEQQKYLTLSSAMQLVCDELTSAKYTAKFILNEERTAKHYQPVQIGKDTQDNPVFEDRLDYIEYYYEQTEGGYPGGLPQTVLPLRDALDGLFASHLPKTLDGAITGQFGHPDKHHFESSIPQKTGDQLFELTLTVDADDNPMLTQPVKVEVTLNENYRLSLKAWLEKDSAYTMYGTLLVSGTPQITAGNTSSSTIEWKLSQITREEPTW